MQSLLLVSLFLGLGSFAGFLAGLLGIGGGIILVPLFLFVFPLVGFHPEVVAHTAFATSLAIIVPTAVSSTMGHRKRGNVDWSQVYYLAVGGVAGALAGSSLAAGTDGEELKLLFGIMQILIAGKMLLAGKREFAPVRRHQPSLPLLLIGMAGGGFSSFFGVGGGVVAVPLMTFFLRLPIHQAVGNSSALIVISALFGALSYMMHGSGIENLPPYSIGYVNWLAALLAAPFTVICARLGVRVASRTPHAKLLKVFAVVLILVGVRVIAQYLSVRG